MSESELFFNAESKMANRTLLDYDNQKLTVLPSCLINSKNDLEAVTQWLNQYVSSVNTYKYYKKEARRLVLWCTYISGKYFTDLTVQDLEKFFDFLRSPDDSWIASKSEIRMGSKKLFCNSGLSGASFNAAVRAINSMFNYFVNAKYLDGNPIRLMRAYKSFSVDHGARKYQVRSRMLNEVEWNTLLRTMNEYPENTETEVARKNRTWFIIAMLYFLGLRINELATHSWSSFRKEDGKWWFYVKGKGGKEGHIPVNTNLMNVVELYRASIGKKIEPSICDTEYLLCNGRKPISIRLMYKLVKDLAGCAAMKFDSDSDSHKKLKLLSPHWLRHLSASHQDKLGIPATMIRDNHRHSSFQTTQIYLHSEDDSRYEEMQKMSIPISFPLAKEKLVSGRKLRVNVINAWNNEKLSENFFKSIEENILIDHEVIAIKRGLYDVVNGKTYGLKKIFKSSIEGINKEAEYRMLRISIDF
ncbi:MAG: tyrosine-type recombinase/integrase [Francisellaceae bacterium]|nr:tyrosine-type recombinase/integrase [Francisellaceae bacterium]MBT6538019.1 tyrosine-type recombinase/integrase [Francisellaceae bacterium]